MYLPLLCSDPREVEKGDKKMRTLAYADTDMMNSLVYLVFIEVIIMSLWAMHLVEP
jgi:hypothetical protein